MPHSHGLLAACSLTALLALAPAAATAADPVEDSFIYKQVDGRDLRIDWTRPADWKASDRRGAVLFIHGGGWTGGTPDQFAEHSTRLAAAGVVCFRVQYRLIPKGDSGPPDQCIEDVTDAMVIIRSRAAQFGIDPGRIAAGGGSAGGHLAAYLGMMDDPAVDGAAAPQIPGDDATADQRATDQPTGDGAAVGAETISRRPAALLLFNPVFDNGPDGWGHQRVGARYRQYSPIDNISPDDPPTIIFLGTADGLIPVATGRRFCETMQQQGVRCELHLYDGQPHGFFNANRDGGQWYKETMAKSEAFLQSLGWFENQAP